MFPTLEEHGWMCLAEEPTREFSVVVWQVAREGKGKKEEEKNTDAFWPSTT